MDLGCETVGRRAPTQSSTGPRPTYLVALAARSGRNAAGSLAWPPGSQPQFLRESARSPYNSQSSGTAFQRAAELTSPNRTRRLRGPISCGGGRGMPSPAPFPCPPPNQVQRFLESNHPRSIGEGRVLRVLPHSPSPPALPTPGGAPLIDVSPGDGLCLARTQAGRGRIPDSGCGWRWLALRGYT